MQLIEHFVSSKWSEELFSPGNTHHKCCCGKNHQGFGEKPRALVLGATFNLSSLPFIA